MDTFTAARQNLGRKIYAILKDYKRVEGSSIPFTVAFGGEGREYKTYQFCLHRSGSVESGTYVGQWLCVSGGFDLMGVRITPQGPEDAVSEHTTEADLKAVTDLMPLVEAWWKHHVGDL